VIGLPTGTITPTQGIVRTSLVGSDPRDFHPVSGGYQFVVLFANWSPASKSMAPIFNAMEEKYNDKIQFVYLDIDDPANGFYKMLLGERLPPLIFILDGVGVVTRSWQGFTQRVTFEQALDGIAP
jgi:thiol-disulfide isomerase/thioredoxin